MRFIHFLIFILIAAGIMLVGCERPEGPRGATGPEGPPGPQGPDPPMLTYLGDDANTCGHCHSSTVGPWMETLHPDAFTTLEEGGDETNLYCVQCHVTGFDAEVSFGDTVVTTPGPDLYGFDDYYPPQTYEDSVRVEELKGVQCEACHGPMGPTIYDHAPIVTFETRMVNGEATSMCAQCHEQLDEWYESGHGMVLEANNITIEEFNDEFNSFSTCWECHTGEGFAGRYDPTIAAAGRPAVASLIGCPSCHDPHDGTLEAQLRSLDSYSVEYDASYPATFSGYGPGQLCVQCHHARRTNSDVQDQIEEGTEHFGPHGSPQMDMAVGSGSYEIEGYDYDRMHVHQVLGESCVTCHMTTRPQGDPLGWKGGHDFEPSVTPCQICHNDLTVEGFFDHSGGQTEIENLMDELLSLIGVPADSLGSPTATTAEQRMAGYAYMFVLNDGSLGVHNPAYAQSLLENALDYLNSLDSEKSRPYAKR